MSRLDNLGTALRLLRHERGWTQAKVASRAGLSVSMLSHYESGKRNPTLDSLGRLLDALEVDLGPFDGVLERVNERPASRPPRPRRAGRKTLSPETVAQALGLERSSDRRIAPIQDRLLKAVHALVELWPSPKSRRARGLSAPPDSPRLEVSATREPVESGDGPL